MVRRWRARLNSAPAVLPDQQPDDDRQQRQRAAADQRVDDEVGQHLPDPGLGALGLAGDQGVPVDQLGGAGGVGLAELHRDADPLPRRHPDVGQHRPGQQHHVPGQVGPDHGVVAGQRGLAAAVQEDRGRADQRSAAPTSPRRPRATKTRRPAGHRHAGLGARLRHGVEGDRGGDAGVEGLDLVGHRDRDELVAGLGDQPGQSVALGPDDDDQRAVGQVEVRQRRRRRPRPGRRPCSRPPGRPSAGGPG